MEYQEQNSIPDSQKELCAVTTIRRLVELYAQQENLPYDQAFYAFAASRTYQEIFIYESGLWRESARYLLDIFCEELAVDQQATETMSSRLF